MNTNFPNHSNPTLKNQDQWLAKKEKGKKVKMKKIWFHVIFVHESFPKNTALDNTVSSFMPAITIVLIVM